MKEINSNLVTCRVELNDDRIIFPTGLVLRRDQCIAGFGAWIDRIIDFGRSMKSMEIDLPTMACLTALVLLKGQFSFFLQPHVY